MALTALAIKNAQSREKSWKLTDEKGLYLLISPRGSKRWHFKFHINGREKKLSFGPFPEVSLQTARQLRDEARATVALGQDPARLRKSAKLTAKISADHTFGAIGREYIEKRVREGIAEATRSKAEWMLSKLEPGLGNVPIAEILPQELLAVLVGVQDDGNLETARRLRSFASRIFRFAGATCRATSNPADMLKGALVAPQVRHHPSIIEVSALGKLLRDIEDHGCYPSTKGALRLSPHLFQRPGEIRMMKWADIDFEAGRWTIPAGEAKTRRRHEVPLTRQSQEIIRSMEKISGHSEFVFPAFHTPLRPLSENSVNGALRRMGYAGVMTAHGFRSTASTLLNECRKWNPDAIERALSHEIGSAVRSAYNHSSYWEERAEMMAWWSDELDRIKSGPR